LALRQQYRVTLVRENAQGWFASRVVYPLVTFGFNAFALTSHAEMPVG
jgi:hypothetical protein